MRSSLILEGDDPHVSCLNHDLPCSPGEPPTDTPTPTHGAHWPRSGAYTYPCGNEAEVGGRGRTLLVGCLIPAQLSPCTWLALADKHHPKPLTAHHLPPWAPYLSPLLRERAQEGSACHPPNPQYPFPSPGSPALDLWLSRHSPRNTQRPTDTSKPAQHATTTHTGSLPLSARPSISFDHSSRPCTH